MLCYSKQEALQKNKEEEGPSHRRSMDAETKNKQSPPSKSVKSDEDVDLMSLMDKIPSDMKLTRAQFEQLLRAHKASNAKREPSPAPSNTSSKESKSRGRQRSRSPNVSVRLKLGMFNLSVVNVKILKQIYAEVATKWKVVTMSLLF